MISKAQSAVILTVLTMPLCSLQSQEVTAAERTSVNRLLDKSIRSFRVVPRESEQRSLKSLPVLRWTNDVRESHSVGLLSLWVDRGRPVAVLGTYVWQDRLMHEFDSVSRSTLQVFEDETLVWEPSKQVDFTPEPNKISVERSEAGRMRQMKSIASQMSVTMLGWRQDLSDREQLRLLPRELYRYPVECVDCLDGAIFAYVLGTDPEALLVMEAIERNGQNEWQYAFVRQTSAGLETVRDGVTIWQVPPHPPRNDRNGLGFTFENKTSVSAEVDPSK
jgi:hypothetical protein